MQKVHQSLKNRWLVLLVAAVLSAFGVIAMSLTTNATAAPSGAGYTSVDETVDGTGHCLHGNPAVNCNAYDGKQYVWLNGGPSVAYLGDGDYFFAVLAPGGQADPSDGTSNNLSDDFDAYTNRSFSVAGGIVSYGGTHDSDGNKIRLADYADTTNPGGVYIMAICSLSGGYPVDPSSCKYDAFKVDSSGTVTKALDLTVTKDALASYDNTYTWTITKDVDKTIVRQVGGTATFNYTVTATPDGGTISNVSVTGTISVFNPNLDGANVVPVDIDSVTDELSDGTVCTVTGGGAQTLTLAKTTFAYSCDLGGSLPSDPVTNTATVAWSEQLLDNGNVLDAASADFTFPTTGDLSFDENTIDECVNVTDAFNGGTATSLGTVCVGDATNSFQYQRGISVLPGCHSYTNSAVFTTTDSGATDSAGQTVQVCGPAVTSALTMGFWKNTNGNSLIQNYCAPVGKQSLATYLSSLGAGAGPFSDAAGKACSGNTGLVNYVNAIFKAATATDMNKMLRAQMLATALDVYFSDPNKGYSTTASGKIKPPSAFLTHGSLGGFNMDMTAICPMVDNTTAGTATCKLGLPSTNGFASGAFPAAAMTVQALLDYEATVPPFNGNVSSPNWYSGNRTKQETAKNAFDQINNGDAFGA